MASAAALYPVLRQTLDDGWRVGPLQPVEGLVGLAAPYIEAQAGVRLNPLQFDPWELIVVPALVALAAVAGLMPALTAYRTDVAKSLSK